MYTYSNYNEEELQMISTIINLIGRNIPYDEALEIYEETMYRLDSLLWGSFSISVTNQYNIKPYGLS